MQSLTDWGWSWKY